MDESLPFIMLAAVSILLILILLVFFVWKKNGQKREDPDYYMFFLMGIVWAIIGGAMFLVEGMAFNGLFAIGIIFLAMGLGNKKKWKNNRKKISRKQKMIFFALVMAGIIIVALTYIMNIIDTF